MMLRRTLIKPKPQADVATAVLTMVVSASTVIARAFSRSVASTTATGSSHNDARKSEDGVGACNGP